jgi:sarcosine oxidase, subunit beta
MERIAVQADIVICGAGIAGIAAARHLAAISGVKRVVLVDERPPLTLTSDKSTECYRNWWPGPGDAMVALTNRSIDLLEALAAETGNAFHMNRRGYLFATAGDGEAMVALAHEASALGAGPVRLHDGGAGDPSYTPHRPDGFEGQPEGIDLIRDPGLIRRHFPWLSPEAATVAHARRCGWLSAQQFGMTLLDDARTAGVTLVRGRVAAIDTAGGRVNSIRVETPGGAQTIAAPGFVNAAGPYAPEINRMLGVALPIALEGHVKISFADPHRAMPRDAPLVIWNDPVHLPWSGEERADLALAVETRHLLAPYPAGVHGRPEGSGDSVILYWTYDVLSTAPVFPVPHDPAYPEITIRGMSRAIPALARYFDQLPRPYIDGGYYTKTPENRPLVGPLPIAGAFISSAFSGFGIMTAMAAGELLAAHATGESLPDYALSFAPSRYDDPAYRALLADWPESGEL